MNLLIVLHFDLLPFFLDYLTDIVLMARTQRVPGASRGGNWHQSWTPARAFLQAAAPTQTPPPRHHTRQEAGALTLLFS